MHRTQEHAHLLEQLAKVLLVLWLHLWEAFQLLGHIKLLSALLLRDLVHGRAAIGGGRAHQLACWRPDGRIPGEKHPILSFSAQSGPSL